MSTTVKLFRSGALCALLLLGLSWAPRLAAQGNTGTIAGTVSDPSGAAVPDATVEVRNVGTGLKQSVMSDAQGRFRVPELNLGNYEVQASKTGFESVVRQGITLTVGSQVVSDFTLPVGQAQQTVTVQAQTTQVETTNTALSSLVEPTQMSQLPLNGRNFAQLLTLAPGVQQLTSQVSQRYGTQANYSVAGSRGEGQLFLLDGANTAGFFNHGTGSGATGTTLGVEAIAEFQTLTNTYSAQFGGNGAVVNAATKSGTNSIHGSAYEFVRNSAMDARNFFDTFVQPGSTVAAVPAFRRNQFGGSAGGPVIKDKAFFFVNYEGIRQLLGQTQPAALVPDANAHNGLVPCATATTVACNQSTGLANVGVAPSVASTLALFPLPPAGTPSKNGIASFPVVANQIAHENYFLGRFDYTLSAKDSLFVRYVYDGATLLSPFNSSPIPIWPENDLTANHFATIEEKRIISPTLINLLRFSFLRPTEQGTVNTNTPPLKYYGPAGPDGRVAVTGLSALGPGTQVPFVYIPNHFVEADDVLWTKGSHSFSFGISVDRIRNNTNNPFQLAGQYSFSSLVSFLQGTALQFAGPVPGQTDGFRDYRELLIAPYFHDEWKVTSRLTLNLGIRYDWNSNPTEARHGLTAILHPPFGTGFIPVQNVFLSNPSTKNFAPRIGLAFDPFKDHKTSIRAGWGMFYDPMLAREYIFGYSLSPPFALGSQAPVTYGQAFKGGGSPNLPSANSGFDDRTDHTPYMMQYNFNIQRDIGFGTIMTVGYVGSEGVHLLANREENPPTPTVDANGVYHFANLVNGKIVPNPKLNPLFGPLPIKLADGHSNYNSLQLGLNRRFSNNLQFQLSYTYSKSIDNSSQSNGLESSNSPGTVENEFQPGNDRGRSDFDRTHSLRVSGVYSLPFHKNVFVSGWQLSGIESFASGPPFTVQTGFDQTGFIQNLAGRPNLLPGRSPNPIIGLPTQWYDPSAYSLNAVGTFGNLGRNTGVGPGLVDTDFAVLKETKIAKISEKFSVQFRAEIFNIFNHANLGLPNLTLFTAGTNGGGNLNPNAGRITVTTTTSRQIQLALKFIF
jgi:hypothetical protein